MGKTALGRGGCEGRSSRGQDGARGSRGQEGEALSCAHRPSLEVGPEEEPGGRCACAGVCWGGVGVCGCGCACAGACCGAAENVLLPEGEEQAPSEEPSWAERAARTFGAFLKQRRMGMSSGARPPWPLGPERRGH